MFEFVARAEVAAPPMHAWVIHRVVPVRGYAFYLIMPCGYAILVTLICLANLVLTLLAIWANVPGLATLGILATLTAILTSLYEYFKGVTNLLFHMKGIREFPDNYKSLGGMEN